MSRVASISPVTGQDGSCLSELPLDRGCTVLGLKEGPSGFYTGRVDRLVVGRVRVAAAAIGTRFGRLGAHT